MGKVCAVETCNSGSAVDMKRRLILNSRKPIFFKVPKNPTKRQKWIDSLSTDLSSHQYICDLHFQNNDIQHHYITNLPSGEVNKISRGRITLTPESVPMIANEIRSPIVEDCGKLVDLNTISANIESHNEEGQKQQTIGELQGKSFNDFSDNSELLGGYEQEQQQQGIEQQFDSNEMGTEPLKQTTLLSHNYEKVGKNLTHCRLAAERKLSYPDKNVTIKSQKKFELGIDYNSQMDLSNDSEVLKIISLLNIEFPIAWTFVPRINQLIAIQFDRIRVKERVRIIINDDQSVLVTYLEHYKKEIQTQIKSVNDLINFMKLMELKMLCTGTGFDFKSFSSKCYADVSDIYKRSQATPRCPKCRKLRVRLQKLKVDKP